MKKAPAAPAITTTPMIVKRYVPMPPVCGRECNLVSETFTVAVGFPPFSIVTSFTFTTEYPAGAFFSTILYFPSSSPFATTTPFFATIFVTLVISSFAISSSVAFL